MARRPKVTKAVSKRKPKVEVVEVDEARIEDAVGWINDKIKSNIHGTYLEIGNYIFENFFDGDLEQVKSFNPHKASSFRKLTERDDVMTSKTNLYNSVHVAVQEKLLLPAVQLTEQLSFTHKVALLPLKSVEKKAELANKAIDEHLTVEELKEQVKEAKKEEPQSPAGRPTLPGFLKNLSKMYKITTGDDSLEGLNSETISGLKEDERLQVKEKIRHIMSLVSRIDDELENYWKMR